MQKTLPLTSKPMYLTYCPVCHCDAEELVIGEVMKYVGEDGALLGYGHPGGDFALELVKHEIKYDAEMLQDTDKAPAGEPCANCEAAMQQQRKQFEQEVINGALHWFCEECNLFGIIVADDSLGFAAGVRAAAGIQPPNQMGVRFTDCHQHESEEDYLTAIN